MDNTPSSLPVEPVIELTHPAQRGEGVDASGDTEGVAVLQLRPVPAIECRPRRVPRVRGHHYL